MVKRATQSWQLGTLVAVVSVLTIVLFVPQHSLAQAPNLTGNWNGSVTNNNQTDTGTSNVDAGSANVSVSVQTSTQSGTGSGTQSTSGQVTTVQMLFSDGTRASATGTVDGNNFGSGNFTLTDSTGRTINGTASGSLASSNVTLNYSGTASDGTPQNGGVDATSQSDPPPDPCGGHICYVLC